MRLSNCNVTLDSWNVRGGINNRAKWFKVLSYLKSISADITFLQETHIKHNEQRLLNGTGFHRCFNLRTHAGPEEWPFCSSKQFHLNTYLLL